MVLRDLSGIMSGLLLSIRLNVVRVVSRLAFAAVDALVVLLNDGKLALEQIVQVLDAAHARFGIGHERVFLELLMLHESVAVVCSSSSRTAKVALSLGLGVEGGERVEGLVAGLHLFLDEFVGLFVVGAGRVLVRVGLGVVVIESG